MVSGASETNQLTSSVHGGVVSDPEYVYTFLMRLVIDLGELACSQE
jgi:hypothetical protein